MFQQIHPHHPVRAVFSMTLLCLVLLTTLPLQAAESAVFPRTVRVDASRTWGIWEGWGVSLCWMGKVFGDRDEIADVLFTEKDVPIAGTTLPGLGFNIVRYNAGGSSWNEIGNEVGNGIAGVRRMQVSKTILPFRQIEGFWTDPAKTDPKEWSWNADSNQREMMRKAKERGANLFELFSNSPMWWMCANDNPSGASDARQDNLPEKNYGAFALYLAAVAKQARDVWGIPFTSVEPFNEATSAYWNANGKQEGCHFSAKAQATFLPILRAELDRQGLGSLPIAASDESLYDQAISVWREFPPQVRALVSKFNVHGYQHDKGARDKIYDEVVVSDHKTLWNSEYGDKIPSGLEMARNIHRDFRGLHPTAWCYWQPLDKNSLWAMITADMETGSLLGSTPKHHVMAQYSRHIRPGMTILEAGDWRTIAALSPDRQKLVLVALNDTPAPVETRFDFSLLGFPKASVSAWVTETAGGKLHARQPEATSRGGIFSTILPAASVSTFEIVPEKP